MYVLYTGKKAMQNPDLIPGKNWVTISSLSKFGPEEFLGVIFHQATKTLWRVILVLFFHNHAVERSEVLNAMVYGFYTVLMYILLQIIDAKINKQ